MFAAIEALIGDETIAIYKKLEIQAVFSSKPCLTILNRIRAEERRNIVAIILGPGCLRAYPVSKARIV